METSTTLIGLGLVLITMLPIVFLLGNQHIKKSKIENILKQYNQGNAKAFTIRDTINNKIVAFDEQNKKLVLIDLNVKPEVVTFADLKDIGYCEIQRKIEQSHSVSKKELITKVEIVLEKKSDKMKIPFKFYDFEYEKPIQITLFRDNQLAEKWLDIIKKVI
jgi:hypothetical protein